MSRFRTDYEEFLLSEENEEERFILHEAYLNGEADYLSWDLKEFLEKVSNIGGISDELMKEFRVQHRTPTREKFE